MPSTVLIKEIPITSANVNTPQEERFGSNIEWAIVQNDCPFAVNILGHDNQRILHIPANDLLPLLMGSREFNSLRIYGEAVSAAGDILVGNVLYIHWSPKRR